MIKLSIVIPVYFNEDNIPYLYEKLKQTIFNNTSIDYELIFVDDGSKDNSYNELKKLREKNDKIKLIKLSRNFGSHTAILAGLSNASGDCATVISADLQDPPTIILDMLEQYGKGNKVVLAVREDRKESFSQKFFSNTYYKMMKKFALSNMPEGGFDCFLIDKMVIEVITSMKEKNSSLMGQILWCGFKTEKIYYVRQEREIGKSRWTLAKKVKLFVDSFMAFSYTPIKAMSSLGFIVSSIGFLYGIYIFINKIFNGIPIEGWTSLMIVILLLSGIQMILLGVIGEYLWRSFDESRKRPTFIIEDKEGL
ncbi:MAG: glycosyltransferase family 2 protein [Sedimentibacter saalensis]|uniref:glycosyltransferase family 2 protein n=1 Tax=Sedimentibacter saalensis TaxID=130788 RepID=UPI0031584F53